MNFSYGIIAIVGVLAAISLVLIALDPNSNLNPKLLSDEPKDTDIEIPPALPAFVTVSIPAGSGLPGCEETDECFIPFDILVKSGGTVLWKNDDNVVHTVTSGRSGAPNDLFDSSILSPDAEFEFTFDDIATIDYYCIVHPWMIGTVTVQ